MEPGLKTGMDIRIEIGIRTLMEMQRRMRMEVGTGTRTGMRMGTGLGLEPEPFPSRGSLPAVPPARSQRAPRGRAEPDTAALGR